MDVEKYTNSKVYDFFEWLFKLIIWNVLTVVITFLGAIIPFLVVYFVKDGIVAAIFSLLTIILAVFLFIPSYATIFCCIKIYKEDGFAETFKLYFNRWWDNFKALFRMELIILGVCSLFITAIYCYYWILKDNQHVNNIWMTIIRSGYYFLIICLFLLFLCFLNVPMVVGHFRMKTKSLMKFTLRITFKKIFSTFIYLVLFIVPLLVAIFVQFLIPIWLMLGFSFPLFIAYYIARKDYWPLVRDVNEIYKEED